MSLDEKIAMMAGELTRFELLSGFLVILCVAIPWYVAMYVRHGAPFTDRLIFHDMFNLNPAFMPKFAKRYGDVAQLIGVGLAHYVEDIHSGAFPEPAHTFSISDEQYTELLTMLDK